MDAQCVLTKLRRQRREKVDRLHKKARQEINKLRNALLTKEEVHELRLQLGKKNETIFP